MKVNDLRLGNKLLITDTNEVCTIISFSGEYILYDSGTRSGQALFNCFKPIPLTEEWLLKFEFEGKKQPYSKYPFEFYIDDLGNCSCYFKGHSLSIFSFVHQLQNLYFAITGSELQLVV